MAGNALLNARAILATAGVKPGMRLADFGVGRTGHLIFPAATLVGEGGLVYGVDIQPDVLDMLEGRRRQYSVDNIALIQGDLEAGQLAIPEHSLDLGFVVHVLGAARGHEAIAREARRLLKPDGRLFVIDWQPEAQHPVAPSGDFRVHPNEIDLAFARQGCFRTGGFCPSAAHWGRVYAME